MSRNKVQNTHISTELRRLHGAMMDMVAVINSPQRDSALLDAAGVTLDRALFPLLVTVERRGPIGVVDMAERVGRDYTTVSRQVAKLESLGLIARQAGKSDRRVREATITAKGRKMADAIDMARLRMADIVFADWSKADLETLVRLMRRFADDLMRAG